MSFETTYDGNWRRIPPSFPGLAQRLECLVEAAEHLGAELARRSVDPAALVQRRALAEVGRQLLHLHRVARHDAEGLDVHDEAGRRALHPARDHRPVGQPVVGGVDLHRENRSA